MKSDVKKNYLETQENIKKLGEFVRQRRKMMGITESQLAKMLNVRQTAISSIELGKRSLIFYQGFKWHKMAKVLDCSVKDFRKFLPKQIKELPKTDLGRYIHRRRVALKISIKVFAKRMKMPIYRARRLELGVHPAVKYETLRRVASALSVDLSELSKFAKTNQTVCENKLGKIIRVQRKNLCLSGNELAERLGVSRQYINQIEVGAINMRESDNMLEKIANILKLDFMVLKAIRPKKKKYKKRKIKLK